MHANDDQCEQGRNQRQMAQPEAGAGYSSARNELVREVHEFPFVVVFFVLALSAEHNSAMSIRQVTDELSPQKVG